MSPTLPPLDVTVYSDYACPFCYVGDRRINKLAEHFELNITYRSVEIHPETPPQGMPLENLGYPPEQWAQMMTHLSTMADEEGLNIAERTFTTNTHEALLLSEAAKVMEGEMGEEIFELIHEGLFHAFFTQGKNIGDPQVLEDIAIGAGMNPEEFSQAMMNPAHEDALRENFAAARKDGVTSVPTYVINGQVVRGAQPVSALLAVAQEVAEA
jgi:predicted DsbA family dithiol-disulfide isomerase